MTSWKTPLILFVTCALLTACGASQRTGAASGLGSNVVASTRSAPPSSDGPISVQDGGAYVFQPTHPPSGFRMPILTAQQAYNAMVGKGHRGSMLIPRTTTALYGYLTENDTSPPAADMPVWAFRQDGGCIDTFHPTTARCFQWTFARAADGKDLGVLDQQTHP